MKFQFIFLLFSFSLAVSGCTSSMATAMGGPLAGAAIQQNNEAYSEQ